MIYIGLLIILLIVWFLFNKIGNCPKIHKNVKLENLREYLEIFYFRGFHNSYIVVDIMERNVFVQFSKYLSEENKIQIECDFPIFGWSKKFEPELKHLLKEKGYEFVRFNYSEENGYGLKINPGKNFESLLKFTRLILLELFELKEDEKLSIEYFGIGLSYEIQGKTEEVPSKEYCTSIVAMTVGEDFFIKFGMYSKKTINFILVSLGVVPRQNEEPDDSAE